MRLALQIGAEVQLVRSAVPVGEEEQEQIPDADEPTPRSEAARALDELGGIGAILRYALDEGQPTADLYGGRLATTQPPGGTGRGRGAGAMTRRICHRLALAGVH